jgi:predicted transcriptional regulator
MSLKDFIQGASKFTKNPLGILTLLIVLVYGIAGIVSSSTNFGATERVILVLFLVIFPIIVLFSLYNLVTKHHDKLYSPSDFVNEENFVKLIENRLKNSPLFIDLQEDMDALAFKDSDQEEPPEVVEPIPLKASATAHVQTADNVNLRLNQLNKDAKKVLETFRDGKHTYRSASGIAKDVGLSINQTRGIIFNLVQDGLLSERKRNSSTRYFINNEGRLLLRSLNI